MREETIKKFREFDFAADARWQELLRSLYPTPTLEQIKKRQKKWYKEKVDPEFDLDFDLDGSRPTPQSEQPHQHSANCSHQHAEAGHSHAAPPVQVRPFSGHKLYHVEGLLKVAFVLMAFVGQFMDFLGLYTLLAALVVCLLGIYRQIGRVQFTKEYAADLMANEFGVTIFFIFSIVTVPNRGPFVYLPLILQFAIGIAEFEARTTYGFLKFQKLTTFFAAVLQMKNEIKVGRAYIELFNVFYFLLLVCLGKSTLILILIYGNFIKFKYKLNQATHYAVNSTRAFLKLKVQSVPVAGKLLDKAVDGIFWLITV